MLCWILRTQEQMSLLSITIILLIYKSAPEAHCAGFARLDAFHRTDNTFSCVFGHLRSVYCRKYVGLLPIQEDPRECKQAKKAGITKVVCKPGTDVLFGLIEKLGGGAASDYFPKTCFRLLKAGQRSACVCSSAACFLLAVGPVWTRRPKSEPQLPVFRR